jgi:CheY-like chemotaxis protein
LRNDAFSALLLVEDQFVIAMDAEAILMDFGVKSVDTAATVADALRVLKATTPDVCVLDVNLGQTTSLELAGTLAERNIPFIFATGYADSAIIPKALAGVPTVRKPYDGEQLKDALTKALTNR